MILGISSATKTISVGLCKDGKPLADFTISGKDAFTEDLISYIDTLIKQIGEPLTAIAVASGPGSYSGLRGGMATAKTLAQALNIPITEVSTLESIAYNLIDVNATIIAVSDARRDDHNVAMFTSYNRKLTRVTNDLVMPIDKIIGLLSKVTGELYLCDYTQKIYEKIQKAQPDTLIKNTAPEHSLPLGINVALIGEQLIKEGKTSDLMKMTPKYSVEPNLKEFRS